MRYALIDNSSLTGIQRLLGEIPVKNTAIVDNDILALENYVQAILFYDEIICIDDYKATHRRKRINFFPNIRFISKEFFEYQAFIEKSNEITKNIALEVRAGKINDRDFKEYLDRIEMTFQFTWDQSSSEFLLTQKMLLDNSKLDKEKFNKIYALLFKENNEQYEVSAPLVNKTPRLFDSKGNQIAFDASSGKVTSNAGEDGLSFHFQRLVSSLNWISQRTSFYVLAADYLYADLFIQPLRQSFLQNIIRRSYPSYELGVFNNFRKTINKNSIETISNILSTSNNFDLTFDIPLFTASLAKKTNNSKEIIEVAYHQRDKKHFVEARNKLREINLLFDSKKKKIFA